MQYLSVYQVWARAMQVEILNLKLRHTRSSCGLWRVRHALSWENTTPHGRDLQWQCVDNLSSKRYWCLLPIRLMGPLLCENWQGFTAAENAAVGVSTGKDLRSFLWKGQWGLRCHMSGDWYWQPWPSFFVHIHLQTTQAYDLHRIHFCKTSFSVAPLIPIFIGS